MRARSAQPVQLVVLGSWGVGGGGGGAIVEDPPPPMILDPIYDNLKLRENVKILLSSTVCPSRPLPNLPFPVQPHVSQPPP